MKDIYYKLEDKWFNLLDSLDSKKIPVYKVIDPIEKTGVPSLPVFIALLLVIAYLAVGGTSLQIGGTAPYAITVFDQSENAPIEAAMVKVFDQRENIIASGATNDQGLFFFEAGKGTYYAEITSEGCTQIIGYELNTRVTESRAIYLECVSAKSKTLSLCITPSGTGNVNVLVKKDNLYEKTIRDCGTSKCEFIAEEGRTYSFESSGGFESGKEHTYSELVHMESTGSCVIMKEKPDLREKGDIIVIVKQDEKPVAGIEVALINPNSSAELATAFTGWTDEYAGKAQFTQKLAVGDQFQVKVKGGSNTAIILDRTVRTVTKELQIITIDADQTTETLFKTHETTDIGGFTSLSNVYITAFKDNEEINAGVTNANGELTLGLFDGVEYEGTFWKDGYEYVAKAVKGGEEHTVELIKMTKNPQGEYTKAGTLIVFLAFEDGEIVPGAELMLFKENKQTGIPSILPKTSDEGINSFTSVPPGADYCIVVRKGDYTSECLTVPEIRVGEQTEAELQIKKQTRRFSVEVLIEGNVVRSEPTPEIKVIDLFKRENEQLIASESASKVTGKAFFDIPEHSNIEIRVEYTKDNKIYNAAQTLGDIDQFIHTTGSEITFDLTPLALETEFIGITQSDGTLSMEPKTLESGETYNLNFRIGLPDVNNQKWDSIILELKDENSIFEFQAPRVLDFLTVENPKTTNQKIIITKYPEDKRDTTLIIQIPVRIRRTETDQENKHFKYSATWKKDAAETAKGPFNTPEYNTTSKYCRTTDDGNFVVCTSFILPSGSRVRGINAPNIFVNEQHELEVEAVYIGRDTFRGSVSLERNEDFRTMIFYDPINMWKMAGKTTVSQLREIDVSYSETLVSTIAGRSSTELKHGESIVILANVVSISPPEAVIDIKIDSVTAKEDSRPIQAYYRILGNLPIIIEMKDNEGNNLNDIYDLSSEVNIRLLQDTILRDLMGRFSWQNSVIIEGLTCPINKDLVSLSNRRSGITEIVDDYTVRINFPELCKVDRNADNGVFKITVDGAENTESGVKELMIKNCLEQPYTGGKTIPLYFGAINEHDNCHINIEMGDQTEYSVPVEDDYCLPSSHALYSSKKANACQNVEFKLLNAQVQDYNPNAEVFSFTENLIKYRYTISHPTDVSTVERVITAEMQGENAKGAVYDYSADFKMNVENKVFLESEDRFMPLKIQKYGEDYNCEENYCTVYQMFEFIKEVSKGETTTPFNYAGNFNARLVHSAVSNPDIGTIWSANLGTDVVPISAVPSSPPSLPTYYINTNAITQTGMVTLSFRKGTNYVYLENINRPPLDAELATEVKGLQLRMPVLTSAEATAIQSKAGAGANSLINKLSTDVIVDSSLTEKGTEIRELMTDYIIKQWNITDKTYANKEGASHKVVLAVCDKTESEIATESETSVCSRLLTHTGTLRGLKFAVFPEGESDVYIVGTTPCYLEEGIRRFGAGIAENNPGMLVKRTHENIERQIAYSYLTAPPAEFGYYAIKEKSELTELNEDLQEALQEIGGHYKGFPAEAVELAVNKEDGMDIFIGICSEKAGCGLERGEGPTLNAALTLLGLEEAGSFNIPDDGIMVRRTDSLAPTFYVFAPSESVALKVLDGWITNNGITKTSGTTGEEAGAGCSIFSPTPPPAEEEEEERVIFAIRTSKDFEGEECGELRSWALQVFKHYCPPEYKCEVERTQLKNGYCCPAGTNIQEGMFSNTCVYE